MKRFGYLINEQYENIFPNNCPVIEFADGDRADPCRHYLNDGICPIHGKVKGDEVTNEKTSNKRQ